ncbi:hypothetical protein WG906_12500 [Pedobacter sp. P351]|uniref:hypothetical protein n=1 Tax=Pedobacter superstes TaxID=3133441 RepID=UPI00309C5750
MAQINDGIPENFSQNPSPKHTSVSRKTYLVTLIVALVLLAGIWVWKVIEVNNIKKAAQIEKEQLYNQASSQIVQIHEQHLKRLSKPFVWAIRSEMMRGNLSQVNLYMNEMVKEKNFQLIVVVNDKGTIVSSTNKKDDGKPFSSIGNTSLLTTNSIEVENNQDSILAVTSPIMGLNNRLGTLYMRYAVPPATLNK